MPPSILTGVADISIAFGSRESQAYMTAFSSLDALNEKYKNSVESLGNPRDPTFVLAHALSHAATIKMHRPFAANDYQSNSRCMSAARSVIDITSQVADRSCINPIYGVCPFLPSLPCHKSDDLYRRSGWIPA